MSRQILVVGYRPQITMRLHELDIPYVVWHDRPIKKKYLPGCARVIEGESFATSIPTIKRKLASLFSPGTKFSHVIGGTESAVVTASVARRAFDSRKSRNTVVLRCHNKRMMKEFLAEKGFPLIPFIYAASKSQPALSSEKVIEKLGLPVVVKQLGTSGGRGMVIAHSAAELEPFLQQRVLFEKFIDAPEVSIETFISGRNIQFLSMTQYVEKTRINLVPCGHADSINLRVKELHRRILMALDIEWGLTHAEYYLTGNQIYFGEIAIRPPGGYIMDLISLAHDFDAWGAFVDNELELAPGFDHSPKKSAAAIIIHPGAGLIECIDGIDQVDGDSNCKKLHFYKAPGEYLGPREGVSDSAAYALFCSPSKEETLASVRHAQTQLVFHMRQPTASK